MKGRSLVITGVATVSLGLLLAWELIPYRRLECSAQLPVTSSVVETATNATPAATGFSREKERKEKQKERSQTIFQAIEGTNKAINFFGRIVDQDEQPIPQVTVAYNYSVEHGNMLGVAWGRQEIRKGEATTDATGLFSIIGLKGHSLSVESLTKDGYQYNKRGAMVYDYYGSTASGKFTPVAVHPVVFVMVAKAQADALITFGDNFGEEVDLPGNGTPVRWNLWKGNLDPNGDLQLTLKREPAVLARVGQPVTWSAIIEIIGGGIVESRPNEPLYRAPEVGYSGSLEYPKEEQQRGIGHRDFYIKTADGKYGRIQLELYPDDDGPTARCYIKAYMNPSGSRNLEPGGTKQSAVP